MKLIKLTIIVFLFSTVTYADQLEYLTKAQYIKALRILNPQRTILSFCDCCQEAEDSKMELITVKKFTVKKVSLMDNIQYYSIFLDGTNQYGEVFNKPLDLAYVFVEMDGSALRVADVLKFQNNKCQENIEWPQFEAISEAELTPEEHFQMFLNASGDDLARVFIAHMPTDEDCKAIFTQNYYKIASKNYSTGNQNIGVQLEGIENNFKTHRFISLDEFNSNDVISNKCYVCPGKVKKIAKYLKPNVKCYDVTFLEKETDENGIRFTFFTEVNGKWVFISI